MKHTFRLLLTILTMLAVCGCSSISMVNIWKDPAVSAKKYRKLLIVGITEKTQIREIFEEVFAGEVRKSGAVAIASYTITGDKGKLSRESVEEAVKRSGADGVITARLVNWKSDRDVRSGFIMTEHGTTAFLDVTVTYATFVHQPVDIIKSTKAAIETNLFDTGTGRIVWSGTSSVVNPEGIIKVSTEFADVVIKAMATDGLM